MFNVLFFLPSLIKVLSPIFEMEQEAFFFFYPGTHTPRCFSARNVLRRSLNCYDERNKGRRVAAEWRREVD